MVTMETCLVEIGKLTIDRVYADLAGTLGDEDSLGCLSDRSA